MRLLAPFILLLCVGCATPPAQSFHVEGDMYINPVMHNDVGTSATMEVQINEPEEKSGGAWAAIIKVFKGAVGLVL